MKFLYREKLSDFKKNHTNMSVQPNHHSKTDIFVQKLSIYMVLIFERRHYCWIVKALDAQP